MVNAATRSPGATPLSGGALRTIPATSLPGTKGSGGLTWYSPRDCSTSGKATPAARTSTTTPSPGVIGCEASGSATSTSSSAESGPDRSVIWMARMGRGTLPLRSPAGLDAVGAEPRVGRDDRHPLRQGLRDEQTVERIAVMRRQVPQAP